MTEPKKSQLTQKENNEKIEKSFLSLFEARENVESDRAFFKLLLDFATLVRVSFIIE